MLLLVFSLLLQLQAQPNYTLELSKVINAHNSADSYSNWKLSEFYPKTYLKSVFDKANSSSTEPEYCHAFLKIKKIDLYFLEAFFEADINISKKCLTKLEISLKKFRLSKLNDLKVYSKKHIKPSEVSIKTKELFIDNRGGKVLYDGELSQNHFLLTFDDGPHPRVTPKILSALKSSDILSQFFIVGERVQYWPELLKKSHKEGHVVGNHSWSHPDMRKLSDSQAIQQIESTFDSIEKTLGKHEPFFRFPYGAYNFSQLEYLGQHNAVSFFWNIDTYDWKIKDPVELLKFSIKKIKEKNAGIILMHDIHNQTADMLPHLLKYLNSRSAQTVVFKTN